MLNLSARTSFDSSQTIESVEQEVERLLDEDSLATEVKYGEQLMVLVVAMIADIDVLTQISSRMSIRTYRIRN